LDAVKAEWWRGKSVVFWPDGDAASRMRVLVSV